MINIVIITYLHDIKICHLFNNGTTGEKIDLRTLPAQRLVIFNSRKSVPGRTNAITHNERL